MGSAFNPHDHGCSRNVYSKRYGATTDLWSSRTMQPYISLTVHFVNDDWTLRSVCLQTAYFPDDHKGEIIPQGLKDALSSWNLAEDRLVCMTTDSGTNMIKALQDNEWPNLQCFRHRLHNAIGKSLMAIHSSEIYFLVRKRPMNSLINA